MISLAVSCDDTVAAMASAPGVAARGVLRISGVDSIEVLQQILVVPKPEFHLQKAMKYECQVGIDNGRLQLPADVYLWPTRRSFTGEPLAEIHCVGSPPLLNEILEQLFLCGARPAERGEFTLRAFLAGRIDLVQAEAVLGVIDASSNDQLKTALDQLAGGISGEIATIREELLLHLADLEAGLDFVEEDIDFVARGEFLNRLVAAEEFLDRLLKQSNDRMQSTGNYRVVLAGIPNAGKSTLFNAIIQSETAIVSPVAGTTRDYLSAQIQDVAGTCYELIDTAGWETARDGIESIAGELRQDQYNRADLILWCSAANSTIDEQRESRLLLESCQKSDRAILKVTTKVDTAIESHGERIAVSAVSGSGIEVLRDAILQHLSHAPADADFIGSTSARCRESLQHAKGSICRARELVQHSAGDELVSMELRDVLDHLGRIVGAVYTDDILDRIFSRFCIGK